MTDKRTYYIRDLETSEVALCNGSDMVEAVQRMSEHGIPSRFFDKTAAFGVWKKSLPAEVAARLDNGEAVIMEAKA